MAALHLHVHAISEHDHRAPQRLVLRRGSNLLPAFEQTPERVLAPHVAYSLLAEQVELQRFRTNRVDVQPAGNVGEARLPTGDVGRGRLPSLVRWRAPFAARSLSDDEPQDFWRR